MRFPWQKPKADIRPLDFDEWLGYFDFNGTSYPIPMVNQTYAGGATQEIVPTFTGLGNALLSRNGIVWACVTTRNELFAEAKFQYRRKGQIGSNALFGTTALSLLEEPWPGGTTRKLLAVLDLHVQLSGNGYCYRDPVYGALRVLRPDWVTVILGNRDLKPGFEVGDASTEVIGYSYRPHGDKSRETIILPGQMAHLMPNPDPTFTFRGASWLGPVVQEIVGDSAMTSHKNRFLDNGATPNMVVTLNQNMKQTEFERWIELFEEGHKGVANAYKTIYLAGGADTKVVGADLSQLDFKVVQAHGETRVCNAAGIPPIIVGVSEGLDSATYSNYGLARRAWADAKLRPYWAGACAELAKVADVPGGSELWYDERRIAFLAEDMKDQATILQTQAATMQSLIVSGWTPESAQAFVETGDLSALTHTGLYSVQLQPPGMTLPNVSTQPLTPASPTPGPEAPAALLCSLCEESAGSNEHRCDKCAQLSSDLRIKPADVVKRIAEQFGMSLEEVEIALGLRKAAPTPLEMPCPDRDFLTPDLNRNGSLLLGSGNGHLK